MSGHPAPKQALSHCGGELVESHGLFTVVGMKLRQQLGKAFMT